MRKNQYAKAQADSLPMKVGSVACLIFFRRLAVFCCRVGSTRDSQSRHSLRHLEVAGRAMTMPTDKTAIARRRRPPRLRAAMGEAGIVTNTTDSQPPIGREAGAPTASDIEGPTDLDWVSLCFETEISRCALDSCMAQKRSNCL
jgi:hypothetical protein